MWDILDTEESVRPRTVVAAVVLLAVALVAQVSIVARLDLPGGRFDLVLVLLAAIALIEGPLVGAMSGFVVGVLADLASSHVLGQSALVMCLIGYAVGLVMEAAERSVAVPLAVIGGASLLGTLGYAAITSILGEAAMTGGEAVGRALAAGVYAVLIAPFVFPLLLKASRRLAGGRARGGR
ncbi:putative rod shape-determining protein MreD membrane protein [Frankia canadensis]|uniref:Putative rod shape-determining protein MreD membrane protein n=1 Tax=Frankia canadensis TaxID=1836972 RepID=A0A2I2L0V4_9ACTN|nr:rod shape-determining protein MreD [Frankia canadensis]SNQ51562.1 putative rod shape-determining protein MreD membrane protein [Frankia canadensis]SOU58852.1 putative rod shape-determining protein MreD membrane protein [Frankia canadensis]